jgi:hypothetical protein
MRQLHHITYYERRLVLPSMNLWLGGDVVDMSDYDDRADWAHNSVSLEEFLAQFIAVRQAQIKLLQNFSSEQWLEERETEWGLVPLHWIVSKTWQHSYEHTSNIMRIALLWDTFANR